MKFILSLNIVFLLIASNCFTQTFNQDGSRKPQPYFEKVIDSIYTKNCHIIGIGLEHIFNESYADGHERTRIDYTTPAYNVFYRYLLQRRRGYLFAFSGVINCRSGEALNTTGSNAGETETDVNFTVYRLNVGASFFGKFGKEKNFGIGPGISFGLLSYYTGTSKFHGSLAGKNFIGEGNINERRSGVLSLNLEANNRVRINSKKYLICGIKQSIETVDYFGYGKNFVTYFYLGYNF